MKLLSKLNGSRLHECAKCAAMLALCFALAVPAYAQAGGTSPWENAVNVLQQAFTGTIAKGLALLAIVVGGLTFAFGEGGGKHTFAGMDQPDKGESD